MKTCCACGFREKRDTTENNERVSYHSFPKKKDMRQAWVSAIGKKDFVPTKSSILCSLHFAKECLYYPNNGGKKQRIRLRPDSIPTLFDVCFWKRRNRKGIHMGYARKSKQSQDDNHSKDEKLDMKVRLKTESESDTNMRSALFVNDVATCSKWNKCQMKSKETNSDLRSPVKVMHNWKMAMTCISSQRKEIAILRRKNYCLQTKVAILEMLLADWKGTC
ncbi:PREDICTED: THAP domain-containing protein 2-like isoform X2 [Dinoponera quadriceps]|uniref:THAP domain-containing protein 2-like isoform X2 n=1 Tax=Dinoponera quadriceps TaxID=609295 RepID=A0A6P3Y2Z0_DINQU|nr:PREDICTED: THAP domain-containing protein 2-like isoform X2 [Dinoponera quadriceps]